MKAKACGAMLAMGLLASSCAFDRGTVLSEAVGPPPETAGIATTKSSDGILVVYSSFEVTAAPPGYAASAQIHTPYNVSTLDGKLVKHVANNSAGTFDDSPDAVALPAGNYKVAASAQGFGPVVVPVAVVAGEETTVHLDSNDELDDKPNVEMVRLPDGQIIGWLASRSPVSAAIVK